MILFAGDPHGRFRHILRAAAELNPSAVVLLGDLEPQRPLHEELEAIAHKTWFIHGNHDTDSEADYDNLFESSLAHRNLHGRVVEIGGFRVAGLGGVFRERIWAPPLEPAFLSGQDRLKGIRPSERWRGGIPLRHRSSIFPDEVDRLSRQRADVLVTHEAPGGHPRGWKALDQLAGAMGAQVLVHGHLHQQIDYAAEGRLPDDCRYQAYGVDREFFLTWPRARAIQQFIGGIV